MFSLVGSPGGVGNKKTHLLPTPFTASRRRRPRHHNALSDRDLFDVGQRELVALAEALGHGRGDDAAHRVRDLQQVARPTTRRHDDVERIPVLLDQAQLREARFCRKPCLRRAARAAAARRRSAARSRESTRSPSAAMASRPGRPARRAATRASSPNSRRSRAIPVEADYADLTFTLSS